MLNYTVSNLGANSYLVNLRIDAAEPRAADTPLFDMSVSDTMNHLELLTSTLDGINHSHGCDIKSSFEVLITYKLNLDHQTLEETAFWKLLQVLTKLCNSPYVKLVHNVRYSHAIERMSLLCDDHNWGPLCMYDTTNPKRIMIPLAVDCDNSGNIDQITFTNLDSAIQTNRQPLPDYMHRDYRIYFTADFHVSDPVADICQTLQISPDIFKINTVIR